MTYFIDKMRIMQLSILIVCFLSSQNVTGQLSLPWTEDFEGATAGTYTTNQNPIPGLTGTGYSWEVELGANGRARTNAGVAYSNGGSQALTLDAATNGSTAINYLIANLDLSNYGGTNDLELIFNYSNHGEENSTNDRVWMRGSSADAWVEVYDLYANRPGTGQYAQVTLDIDALIQTAGQTITSTFQLRFGQEDNFQATSPTGSDGFTFDDISITGSLPLPNNAGITALLSPVLGAVAGSYPVDVTMNNFGNNPLSTVTIEWTMNGTAQTPVSFTGPALAPATSTTVNLSPSTAFAAGLTDLKIWTSNPNGLPDADNNNDTLEAFFCTGLAGTYTVGTPTSDFPTFQDALTALYGCGVGGPVTMEVQAGVYTTALTIDQPIPGISATNRVTWDGLAQTASINVSGAAAVALDGADYITIQNFLLINSTTTTGWGVWLSNEANYNEILNNRIQMATTNSFNTSGIVATATATSVSSSGNNANYTLVEGNVITGADRGISFYGSSTTTLYNSGNIIRSNDISGADNYGIYTYYQDSITIENNYIHDLPSTFHYGIYTYYLMNFDVVGNNINVADYGIYFNRSNSQITPTRQALIANNMVNSTTDRGIYLFFTRETDFYHNTIVSGASACIWSNFDNTVDVKNNIFVSTSTNSFNYAFETFTTNTFADMDYNAFYTNPANPNLIDFGSVYTDLVDWQTNGANAYDQNSLEGLPTFYSATDLHIDGAFLNDRGIATTAVTTDIDGDVRPALGASSVDIGADEFTPPSNDAGVLDLASPTLPIVGGFASVEVVVRNYGIVPLNSFMVGWTIDGTAQTMVPYSGASIPVGGTANMILANVNFPANTTSLEFWTSMPNGLMDERLSNDTLTIEVCPGLSGTYSVGHSSSDFATAAEALDALMSCGVSGPVTMEFVAGTYTGPWVLNEIPGASLTNTVTFDGLNAANAMITHDASGLNRAATVTFDGVDYFTIKNFSIENTGTTAPAYGVLLTNGANYNVIDNNMIVVPVGTSTNVVGILTSNSYIASVGTAAEGNNANYTTISNNDISGGVANIILEGGAFDIENVGNKIMGNNMHDADDYSIYVDEQDSLVISGNTIYDLNATTADAVQLYDIANFEILANDITSRDYGIAIFGGFSNGDEVRNGLIANNMVLTGAGGEAFYLREATLINIYHNTFSGTRACWFDNHFNIDFRNNILNATTGECFYTLDPVSMSGMDHNLYFISGVGGDAVRYGTQTYATLADWQANGVGYDLNSVSGNPNFVNGLYIGGSLPVDTADINLTVPITTDINGDPRPLGLRPDIGADEHVVIANDAMIVDLKSPSGCGSSAHDVIISIANVGSNLILNAPITVNVTGDAVATFNIAHPTLVSGVTIDKNMGTINTEAGGQFNFEIIISAGTDTNPTNDTLRTSVTIAPSNQMALSMVGDTMVCDSSTAMVAAVASYSPSSIFWYDAPTGGNLVHIGDMFTTGNLSATTMYYAEIQGCTSPRAV
ncbi:MAG: Gliding motility-related protein, partial [uncultured Aureispira sp.]